MDDLISRQVMRDTMYHEAFEVDSDLQKWDSGCWIRYKMFENVIDKIPSAQKKGHWVKQNPMVDTEECSACGYNIYSAELETPFCPWCGSDMRGENDV